MTGKRRRPKQDADLIDDDNGLVRVFKRRCDTCIFYDQGARMSLRPERFNEIVEANIATGSLLTCHETLHGNEHDIDPAACNGFWRAHADKTYAGLIAGRLIGVTFVEPPDGPIEPGNSHR